MSEMIKMIKEASVLAASLPPRRTLHCHPSVMTALVSAAPPKPEPSWLDLGQIGNLGGIDVYEEPDMMPGAWEIREGASGGKGGELISFGVLGPSVTGYRFVKDGQEYVFADPVADGSAQ